jgi:Family of unknown function (DUF5681)
MGDAAKKKGNTQYEVGFAKPPVHSRFQKGQSGNPSGRPRRNDSERAKQIAMEEAYRLVTVKDGDGVKRIPAIQAVHRAQIALAAKGNGPAQRAFLRIVNGIEGEQHKLQMELLEVAIQYQHEARVPQRCVELGVIKEDPLMPKPEDVVVDYRTGQAAFVHEDFLQLPTVQRKIRK